MTPTEIKRIRKKLKMTQEEFAHTLGVTCVTVNRWELDLAKPSKLAEAVLQRIKNA